jgi:F-type H+-transporting ATPase subunit b
MEEVLRSLGELALKAIPTFLLVMALHFYLKYVYFRPMGRVLAERSEATEGARKKAEENMARASEKAAEYEAALRAARNDIYHEQEDFRHQLRQQHADAVQQARHEADAAVKEASRSLESELVAAQRSLAQHADALAGQIVEAMLRRRAV